MLLTGVMQFLNFRYLTSIQGVKNMHKAYHDIIDCLVEALEARDPYTCGHSGRVADMALELASRIGWLCFYDANGSDCITFKGVMLYNLCAPLNVPFIMSFL